MILLSLFFIAIAPPVKIYALFSRLRSRVNVGTIFTFFALDFANLRNLERLYCSILGLEVEKQSFSSFALEFLWRNGLFTKGNSFL